MQNSNLFNLKTFRSNDRASKSPQDQRLSKQKRRPERRNLSIPFVMSSRNLLKNKVKHLASSKTDEKRSKRRVLSKIPGTMDCDPKTARHEKSLSIFDQDPGSPGPFRLADGLVFAKEALVTPQKKKSKTVPPKQQTPARAGSGEGGKAETREKTGEMTRGREKDSELLFGNSGTPISLQIKQMSFSGKVQMKSNLGATGKETAQMLDSRSKLSQKFISEVIRPEMKTETINPMPKETGKDSFIDDFCSFDKGKNEAESKFGTKGAGKENETLSYNLSKSIKSKQFEFSGKLNLVRSKDWLGIRQFCAKAQPSLSDLFVSLCRRVARARHTVDVLDVLEDLDVHRKWRTELGGARRWMAVRCAGYLRRERRVRRVAKVAVKMMKLYVHWAKWRGSRAGQESGVVDSKSEKLVKREFLSRGKQRKMKFIGSSKKKDDTITTKEILCQSTKMQINQIKDSYMFNNSYKTGQKRNRRRMQTRTSHYNREAVYSSVLNYSDMSKTNLSNHLKKEPEAGAKAKALQTPNDTFSRVNQTRRKKNSTQNKENRKGKRKVSRRPPMRCIASAIKLTREQMFANSKKGKVAKKGTFQSSQKKLQMGEVSESSRKQVSPHVKNLYQEPPEKKESETDRVIQNKLHLKGLEMNTHKSLVTNFWNDKLTKRQSAQQSKLKQSLRKQESNAQSEAKSTQAKWDRKTAKSLRDKGLDLWAPGTATGESLLSSKQDTSLMKGSYRRVSITGMNVVKNKSPVRGFAKKAKMSVLKIKKLRKKTTGPEGAKLKVNKSIKMNLKGNFRKMKSISPPSNWSMSRFNKMKNNLFRKKKKRHPKKGQDESRPKEQSQSLPREQESPQEKDPSANFFCHNPHSGLKEKSGIARLIKESKDKNSSDKKFFKKTLPEISEGGTNESSEVTEIMSANKDKPAEPVRSSKLQKFKSSRRIQKGTVRGNPRQGAAQVSGRRSGRGRDGDLSSESGQEVALGQATGEEVAEPEGESLDEGLQAGAEGALHERGDQHELAQPEPAAQLRGALEANQNQLGSVLPGQPAPARAQRGHPLQNPQRQAQPQAQVQGRRQPAHRQRPRRAGEPRNGHAALGGAQDESQQLRQVPATPAEAGAHVQRVQEREPESGHARAEKSEGGEAADAGAGGGGQGDAAGEEQVGGQGQVLLAAQFEGVQVE